MDLKESVLGGLDIPTAQKNLLKRLTADMSFKIFSLLFLIVAFAVMASGKPSRSYYEEDDDDSYEFKYQVQDEDEELDFGHKEEKSEGRVQGYYYVLLPDSRLQKVRYYVDGDSGFVAEVEYSGEAQFEDEGGRRYYK